MDYNYYQFEQDIVDEVGGIQGPILEYDRQFLSTVYNNGRDVAATDPTIPACDDDDADKVEGGVDPLCVRYDSEKNPIDGLEHARNNLFAATGAAGTEKSTLTELINSIKDGDLAEFSDTNSTPAKLKKSKDALADRVAALAEYFITVGAQSLRVNLRNNAKALRVWQKDIPVDERDFRSRYITILEQAVAQRELPAPPKAALEQLILKIKDLITANPVAGSDLAERAKLATELSSDLSTKISRKVADSFSKLRSAVYGTVGFDAASPFAIKLSTTGDVVASRFEQIATQTLSQGVVLNLDASSDDIARFSAERTAAATQLKTFKGNSNDIATTITQLEALVLKGQHDANQNMVDESRSLLKLLK